MGSIRRRLPRHLSRCLGRCPVHISATRCAKQAWPRSVLAHDEASIPSMACWSVGRTAHAILRWRPQPSRRALRHNPELGVALSRACRGEARLQARESGELAPDHHHTHSHTQRRLVRQGLLELCAASSGESTSTNVSGVDLGGNGSLSISRDKRNIFKESLRPLWGRAVLRAVFPGASLQWFPSRRIRKPIMNRAVDASSCRHAREDQGCVLSSFQCSQQHNTRYPETARLPGWAITSRCTVPGARGG